MSAADQPAGADAAVPAAAPAPETRVADLPPPLGAVAAGGEPAGTGAAPSPADRVTVLLGSAQEKLPIDPETLERRPEILVGGAFAGGFLLAKVLRAIGRS